MDERLVSLQSRRQACLVFSILKVRSPSRAEVRQICLQPSLKESGSPRLEFLLSDTNTLSMQHPPRLLGVAPVGPREVRGTSANLQLIPLAWDLQRPKVLCLLPGFRKLWQANLLDYK